jgi:hypothetical protein
MPSQEFLKQLAHSLIYTSIYSYKINCDLVQLNPPRRRPLARTRRRCAQPALKVARILIRLTDKMPVTLAALGHRQHVGRAIANGRDEGVTKLLFDDSPEAHGHGKILGGGMVGTHAGDMIGEVALAIEMGADAVDIGKTIHPHPTLGESIGMAAEVAHGSCTDVPPARK